MILLQALSKVRAKARDIPSGMAGSGLSLAHSERYSMTQRLVRGLRGWFVLGLQRKALSEPMRRSGRKGDDLRRHRQNSCC